MFFWFLLRRRDFTPFQVCTMQMKIWALWEGRLELIRGWFDSRDTEGEAWSWQSGTFSGGVQPLQIVTFQTSVCHTAVWKKFFLFINPTGTPLPLTLLAPCCVPGKVQTFLGSRGRPLLLWPHLSLPRPAPSHTLICPGFLGSCRIPGRWVFPPPCLCLWSVVFLEAPPSLVCLESSYVSDPALIRLWSASLPSEGGKENSPLWMVP